MKELLVGGFRGTGTSLFVDFCWKQISYFREFKMYGYEGVFVGLPFL